MSTNKTPNYRLHKWEPQDHFLRSEFNENFAAIDEALSSKTEVIFGTYTGTGTSSRIIALDFTPSVLFLLPENGSYRGGLVAPGHSLKNQSFIYLAVVEGGFQVSYSTNIAYTNSRNSIYSYLAFR